MGKDEYGELSFVSLISIWAVYGVGFIFTYALAEIIEILHDIRRKMYIDKK